MDKYDVTVSIASGALTALIVDTLIIGDISLLDANEWGKDKVENFVIGVAKSQDKEGKVTDLLSAVKFLEDHYGLAADSVENKFGGGSHHHLYDFSHHPTPVGWFFSIVTQFTKTVYGTDKYGKFQAVKLNTKGLDKIYENPVQKVWKGTVDWIFHMISDMAGSRGSVEKGRYGTGLPGPLLSALKEISSNKHIRALVGTAGNTDRDKFSVLVQNLYNGRFLADRDVNGKPIKGTEIPFDLRTEIGLAHELTKQIVPVLINECIVRAFYSIRRFIKELERLDVSSFEDLKDIDFKVFLPFNNPELNQELLISSASFTTVDIVVAGTKAAVKNHGNKYGFAKDFFLSINYVGIFRLGQTGFNKVFPQEKLEKLYDDFALISEKVKDNEVVACISDMPMGVVPATIKVVKTCKESISDYIKSKEERILVQKECDEHIKLLTDYRNDYESVVSGYLISNIVTFEEAFIQMDEAVLNNDSDSFIDANSKIQNKLGKESSFNSQSEFDEIMDSDDDFKL